MNKFPTSKATLLLAFFLWVSCSFAQKQTQAPHKKSNIADTADCLIFTGNLDETMSRAAGNYTVVLLRDNVEKERLDLKLKKPFKFIFQKNRSYTVRIEKAGFVPREFKVLTKMEYFVHFTELHKFAIETNLISQELYHHFELEDGKNGLDMPVAVISYHKANKCYEYDKKYTGDLITRLIDRVMFGGY